MPSYSLRGMIEGDFADTCADNFPLFYMQKKNACDLFYIVLTNLQRKTTFYRTVTCSANPLIGLAKP